MDERAPVGVCGHMCALLAPQVRRDAQHDRDDPHQHNEHEHRHEHVERCDEARTDVGGHRELLEWLRPRDFGRRPVAGCGAGGHRADP